MIANHNFAYVCFICSIPEYAEMAATLASSLLPDRERIFPKVSLNRPTKVGFSNDPQERPVPERRRAGISNMTERAQVE